jgi:hypothetical protein
LAADLKTRLLFRAKELFAAAIVVSASSNNRERCPGGATDRVPARDDVTMLAETAKSGELASRI